MRPGYRQFCPIARSLDLVGRRWTLLVVRELALRGPLTGAAVARGLPDVPVSQLVQRLAELEAGGLAEARDGAYSLTEAGAALEPVLGALADFGLEHLAGEGAEPGEAVVPHLLLRQLELRYAASGARVSGRFELEVTDPEALWSVEAGAPAPSRFTLKARDGRLVARPGTCLERDARLRLPVRDVCRLAAGVRPEEVAVTGDVAAAAALLDELAPPGPLAAVA